MVIDLHMRGGILQSEVSRSEFRFDLDPED